ncbi:hypothetical protein [Micromonospora carbonacea]|uniref:hypothetical protein n=1 Tax=Micromonospora carbonacea TaxID=47853 RepID=UPI003D75585E
MDEDVVRRPLDDWVDVVVLRADEGCVVPVTGGTSVDLDGSEPPSEQLLAELLDSTVRVSAAEGVLSAVLVRLRAIAVPAAFAASPWLADSRPVMVRDGTGEAGGLAVRYSATVGLWIDEPETAVDLDERDG